ncbi:Ribosome biogenesis protein BRX1-like [Porphyridium purpureum]|uniref:Ribosome biogenesis protein BRX1-like n=1 Tax=Porphyridium purpureum TaxID=35688 RepID=A0A5J4ZAJ7_PORPP|nr:Ribosome biogenesis protein BRX1-like [Porphyridium purpureum]|eukprot:POR3849..scf295_1
MQKKRTAAAAALDEGRDGVDGGGRVEGAKVQLAAPNGTPDGRVAIVNKTRVLLFCTRGTTARHRHLMEDLRMLLPHAKKEPKLDSKDRITLANEVAETRNCDSIALFECRKLQDCYLWLSKTPNGPSAKFLVQNIHTMAELKFTGNNLLFSRAMLSFDRAFDEGGDHMLVLKELLLHTFTAPRGHRKVKPFVDHMLSFFWLDGRVWVRHYQIVEKGVIKNSSESELVEIGPRFVLTPIRIFSGSLCGATLWENVEYISPNEVRRAAKRIKDSTYQKRISDHAKRTTREAMRKRPDDPLDRMFK